MATPQQPQGDGHSEVRTEPTNPAAGDGDSRRGAAGISSFTSPPEKLSELFKNVEPTDDSPTVISRGVPRPLALDEVFSGTLRGRRLAHFELIEPIGVGGMAAVIRALDTQLDRPVALKILPPEMANDPECVKRFHQEARSAARLDHENIARVYYCGEDQGLHFIAFEFVEGANLRTILERRGRLPVPEAVHYLLQIAAGLNHAASRGVVHRDIKPSNIIISPNGRAKLVDMGLARSQGLQPDQGLTQSGMTLGTFDYISPEQALEPRDADVRSDIYSLGCTFYHALTGQPPVPEGTAAKKLHHHQHIAPLDPRELNPEIPDEVAAILARMMAKDPKDRYLGVDRLLQHLILVAQRLGVEADVPEGLIAETPLPEKPRMRPVLVGAVAAVLLIALIAVLGQLDPPTGPSLDGVFRTHVDKAPADTRAGKADSTARTALPEKAAVPNADEPKQSKDVAVFDLPNPKPRDLERFLRDNRSAEHILVRLDGDLDLGSVAQGEDADLVHLVFQSPRVTIEKHPEALQRPAIRLRYPLRPVDGVLAALVIRSDEATLKGLRIVVDATGSQAAMAGVLFQGGKNHTIQDCEFFQADPPQEAIVDSQEGSIDAPRLTSVMVDGSRDPVAVEIRESLFARIPDVSNQESPYRGAQDAVRLSGSHQVKVVNCAFGPHATLFRVAGGKSFRESTLSLLNCSALASGTWTGFRLEEAAQCRLQVESCVFSWPMSESDAAGSHPEERRAVLIRQADSAPSTLRFKGLQNRYHNLSAFWVRPGNDEEETSIVGWEAFVAELRNGSEDNIDGKSLVLKQSPWQETDPLRFLKEDKLKQAFLLKPKLRELRQSPDPQGIAHRRLVGVEQCIWGSSYVAADVPQLVLDDRPPSPAAAGKELVVDPKVSTIGSGVYRTLGQALADVEQHGIIRIRHTGFLPVEPVRLEKPTLDVTIRPDPGFRPILTLGSTPEQEPFLFRIHDGRLTLENLEFLLEASRTGYKTQSVVELIGEGGCDFKDCVITLDRGLRDVPLTAVRLADPATVMRMDPPSPSAGQTPVINLENCIVRGDGELLRVRASRAFQLEARNCLLALGGSCFNIFGNAETVPTVPASTVRLERVTAYLGEHLLRWQATREVRGLGLVPLHVRSVDSLFLSRDSESLVHLDGPETSEDKMKDLLLWEGKHSAYCNFLTVLDQRSPVDEGMPRPYGEIKWKEYTGEPAALFAPRIRSLLADPPPESAPLARLSKASFKLKAEGNPTYGANIDRLPTPAGSPATGSVD